MPPGRCALVMRCVTVRRRRRAAQGVARMHTEQGVARMHTEIAEGGGPMSKSHNTTRRRIAFLPKPLFSVRDAAAYLGVSASTVRRRIAAGALRAQRWGRSWIM